MNKIRMGAAGTVLLLLVAAFWMYQRADAAEKPSYRFAAVEQGDVHATVSATGALGAVTTVAVGTQASGKVTEIRVDFNDRVKRGQLLARIDPMLQEQAVVEAQAGVARAEAQYELARREVERNRPLYEAKIVTAVEFGSLESAYEVARANLRSARVSLDRARQNLSYTAIYAPIDGVVVERNVDVGQTVAASLSAPQLFLIANDLSEMQILASVDESDIGRIREGQTVTFTVQSYPDRSFEGTVRQVRLQSATTDNVVNYTAVVAVRNPDGVLLPGMTATVRFLTSAADDVLTVPNAALRFRPTPEMLAQAGGTERPDSAARAARRAAAGEGRRAGGEGGDRPRRAAGAARDSVATLWTLGADGKLARQRVRTGISDGQRTEVRGRGLKAGTQVIVGTATAAGGAASQAGSNPFGGQQQQRGGRGGPPGMF